MLHRLVDIWATGEASASLGFEAARLFDELDPLEKRKGPHASPSKNLTGRAAFKALAKVQQDAIELPRALSAKPAGQRDEARLDQLEADPLVQFAILDSLANVLCPACKLWNTGHGATMMREAVSLMGGYGITEDCPGFLGQKWMDAQLEATYEGPEAVQRLPALHHHDQRAVPRPVQAVDRRDAPPSPPSAPAPAPARWPPPCSSGSGRSSTSRTPPTPTAPSSITRTARASPSRWPTRSAGCWPPGSSSSMSSSSRHKGAANPALADGLPGSVSFFTDLCHVQSARAAGEVGRICAELVYGYNRHPAWDEASCHACYCAEELDALEGIIPGIDGSARAYADVTEAGEAHPRKAGPCVRFTGLEAFVRLRAKLDGCLTGCRLAKDRAAEALTKVMIPRGAGLSGVDHARVDSRSQGSTQDATCAA